MKQLCNLKYKVKNYWEQKACGTEFIAQEKGTIDYFDAIENFRYDIESEIFSFAQFTRFHKKRVLEVGVGAGTDFVQWARAGALCYGIDLTNEAIVHAQNRLVFEGLQAQDLQVADAECLPHPDNFFDLAYSWGVIHHSPDTKKCLAELVRVTKPGGIIKIMIYNRRSLFALYRYLQCALFKGKPFQTFKTVLFNHQESPGTKAYTFREVHELLKKQPVALVKMSAPATNHDLLYYRGAFWQKCARILASLWGWKTCGWYLMIEIKKV